MTGLYNEHNHFSLWSGNIRSMIKALSDASGNAEVQGILYDYDQLNRIKEMRAYQESNLVSNNAWQNPVDNGDYTSSYSYDGDGNVSYPPNSYK